MGTRPGAQNRGARLQASVAATPQRGTLGRPSLTGTGSPPSRRARKNGGRGAKEREDAPDPGQRAIVEAERKGGGAERRPERVADIEGGLVQRRGKVRAVDRFPHDPRLQRDARREEQKAPEDHSGADERNAVDDRHEAKIKEQHRQARARRRTPSGFQSPSRPPITMPAAPPTPNNNSMSGSAPAEIRVSSMRSGAT